MIVSKNKFSQKNKVELIYNGQEFIDLNLKLIQKAKKFIILQTYIFEDDEVTLPIINSLIEMSHKGVEVFILADGYGSRDFTEKNINKMREVGIKFEFFSPIFSKNFDHIGRRIHSKLLCIDGAYCLTGGINLSKRFNTPDNSPPWLDFACYLEGEEVHNIVRRNFPLYAKHFPEFISNHLHSMEFNLPDNACLVRTNINDYMRLKNEIYKSYLKAFRSSQKQIVIVATYFFPGKRVLRSLAKAAARGVEVKLIFTVISDHPLERWSSKYLYSWFLSKGIQIYEWGESIVHGKLALVDDDWVTVGSYNHNFLSRFGNHELNLEIIDKSFAAKVQKEMDCLIEKSTAITMERWKDQQTFKHKVLETFSYIFANILILLSMLILIRKKETIDFNIRE